METLKKRKSHAFKKDIYFLGVDRHGENVWLEAPSWDCEWYWGFGFVERYLNNNNPAKSGDISSHTHINSEFGKGEKIDIAAGLVSTSFTKEENAKLSELFTEFYSLKKRAELAHRKDETMWKAVNEIHIPAITKQIIEILQP